MTIKIRIIAFVASILLIFIILELIRRRKLKPEYSIFWLIVGFIILLFAIFRHLLEKFSAFLGVFYPASALFIIAFACITMILIYITVLISELSSEKNEILKELSILRWKIERLQKKGDNTKDEE